MSKKNEISLTVKAAYIGGDAIIIAAIIGLLSYWEQSRTAEMQKKQNAIEELNIYIGQLRGVANNIVYLYLTKYDSLILRGYKPDDIDYQIKTDIKNTPIIECYHLCAKLETAFPKTSVESDWKSAFQEPYKDYKIFLEAVQHASREGNLRQKKDSILDLISPAVEKLEKLHLKLKGQ